MRRAALSFVILAAAGFHAGCAQPSISELNPEQGSVEAKTLPVTINRDLDLLFLIDDSPSMSDKQLHLAASFPRFIEGLETIPGGLPNVHIGVVSSDYGTQGAEDAAPGPAVGAGHSGGCQGTGQGGKLLLSGGETSKEPYLIDVQDPAFPDDPTKRIRNYDKDLATAFSRMARVGAAGCGFEQHLEALKQALLPSKAENAGFVRPDATLAVIIIADEDDCSMKHSSLLGSDLDKLGQPLSFRCTRFGVTCSGGGATSDAMNQTGDKTGCRPNDASDYLTRVADYAAFLNSLKPGHEERVVVAGIMGTPAPFTVEPRIIQGASPGSPLYPQLTHSCSYINGEGRLEVADPPIRLKAFLDLFPHRNAFAPICQQDLSGGLQQIAGMVKTAILGDPCIAGHLADVDPAQPGPQFDCTVAAMTDRGTPAQHGTAIQPCGPDGAASNQPCWRLATDPQRCPRSDHLALEIEAKALLPSTASIVASCVIDASAAGE